MLLHQSATLYICQSRTNNKNFIKFDIYRGFKSDTYIIVVWPKGKAFKSIVNPPSYREGELDAISFRMMILVVLPELLTENSKLKIQF